MIDQPHFDTSYSVQERICLAVALFGAVMLAIVLAHMFMR
jgi:hypothetical protein